MNTYHHLSSHQRDIISIELSKGTSKKNIASLIGTHISTVYRELNRNCVTQRDKFYNYHEVYFPSSAHSLYLSRKRNNSNSSKFSKDVKFIIEQGLHKQLSFESICNIRHKFDKSFPCTRSLYNYRKLSLITIPKNYRLKLKKRKSASRKQSYLKDANTKHISSRSHFINTKRRFGHWELDLIESASDGGYIISFIERMSKFSLTKYIDSKHSDNIINFLKHVMKKYPVYSITTDNGSEFNRLYELKTSTNYLEVYYTDPAAPYQKGLVEYFNKLLREFIHKNKKFDKKSIRKIQHYTNHINSREMKILNYSTPYKVKELMMNA